MTSRSASVLLSRRLIAAVAKKGRILPSSTTRTFAALPDSIKRVATVEAFPNEYPGQIYAFNWCLNKDGVTPLKRSAFRITKALDLKVASLNPPKAMPLKVKAAAASTIPEAGSDKLGFDTFDEISERTRDLLSLSDHLYCPEGHVPATRTGVRVITNSATLAPDLLAYLERAPRMEPPSSLPITAYVLEGADFNFEGYAIEEIEVPIIKDNEYDWHDGSGYASVQKEAKSVAAVVVAGKKPEISLIVAGIELSQKALAEDEAARAAEKAEQAKTG